MQEENIQGEIAPDQVAEIGQDTVKTDPEDTNENKESKIAEKIGDPAVKETQEQEGKVQEQEKPDEIKVEAEQAVEEFKAEETVQEADEIIKDVKEEQKVGVEGIPQAETAPEGQAEEKIEEPEVKPEPKWYIIQALTGQEDRVKERIENSLEELNLKDKIFRVLVPEEETVEIKGDKRIERKRKMYPGYVFVEMLLDEDTWYKIRSTNGVARFIGGKTKPQAVTDREMQRVLKQLGIKEKEIKVEFEVGEPIRIISGSFRGYTGSVAEVSAAKSKIKAMINIFGRDTSVEVDFDRVEKII